MAAAAGQERAVFRMAPPQDILEAFQPTVPGTTGTLTFPDSSRTYQISLFRWAGTRPGSRSSATRRHASAPSPLQVP